MKKVILIDGNNLLFRSYYATAYSGNMMRSSSGIPTNALYGFTNMINKIINEEDGDYILVAFDKGKTFRHEEYQDYKGKRSEMPDELRKQFPIAKELLDYMGINHYEVDNYEADDIVGTVSKLINNNPDFIGTIVSSDRDLLQLITKKIEVKLLKQTGYVRLNEEEFIKSYGFDPIRIIDLKAIQGDASDNIPGVKGIGEKGALKLISEYKTLENVYDNIDNITGSTKNKLLESKDMAFFSKKLATIYQDIELPFDLEDLKFKDKDLLRLNELYRKLDFYSFIKENTEVKKDDYLDIKVKVIEDLSKLKFTKPVSIYLDLDEENYHNANIIGMSVYNEEDACYIKYDLLKKNPSFLTSISKYTYDIKKVYVSLIKNNLDVDKLDFDMMISAYLLNYNVKEDITYLINNKNIDLPFISKKDNISEEEFYKISLRKAKFIYDYYKEFNEEMEREGVLSLYNDIEYPLTFVLGRMELEGISVNKDILLDMKNNYKDKLKELEEEIYVLAGETFNISSPKQLGEILFEKLNLPFAKKNKKGYTTDVTILNKLKSYHPIIDKILDYRMLMKLYNTYIEGLLSSSSKDGKIHTIYTQTLTRTGRLSSIEPNLQNIPVRSEEGRNIRKAFVPLPNSVILSSDYSQIELRVFAHMSNVPDLIEAFNEEKDIHTKTASDIFGVPEELVTKDMRRKAKAVNFGILYGISSYGLSEDLGINVKEAKAFIEKYLESYPGIKKYMDKEIEDAHKFGYVKTLFNRKRIIEELNNKNYMIKSMGERMALNTPIQGTSADILKLAMIKIDKEIIRRSLKSKMLLQVHDELIFNVYQDELDEMKLLVKDIMENIYKLSVPLKVDIEVGNNWYEAK